MGGPLIAPRRAEQPFLRLTLRKRSLPASRHYTASRELMNRNLLRWTLQHVFSWIKTQSLPSLLRCCPRRFTFYLGNPFPRFLFSWFECVVNRIVCL